MFRLVRLTKKKNSKSHVRGLKWKNRKQTIVIIEKYSEWYFGKIQNLNNDSKTPKKSTIWKSHGNSILAPKTPKN